jgi:DegV family protein with EDD domain
MSIKIVTDSTCDLPQTALVRLDITVVPLYVNIGSQSYPDDAGFPQGEFYDKLTRYDASITTAAPGPEAFRQVYQRLATEGASQIISIHVAANLSATWGNATLAAKSVSEIPVNVIDSKQLSLGTGFLAVAAAQAAARGQSTDQIISLLNHQISRTRLIAVLDDLKFLRRSGRANAILARLGELMQIKPVFTLYNGTPAYERVRTRRQAIARLESLLADYSPLAQVAIIHSHATNQAERLQRQFWHLLPPDVLVRDVSPIIAAHVGPGAVGVIMVTS